MSYDDKFILALCLSVITETLVLLCMNLIFKTRKNFWEVIFTGFLATFSSIVYLWYLLPNYLHGLNYLLWGELAVLAYEMLIIKKLLAVKWHEAFLFSLLANVCSFLLGWIVL